MIALPYIDCCDREVERFQFLFSWTAFMGKCCALIEGKKIINTCGKKNNKKKRLLKTFCVPGLSVNLKKIVCVKISPLWGHKWQWENTSWWQQASSPRGWRLIVSPFFEEENVPYSNVGYWWNLKAAPSDCFIGRKLNFSILVGGCTQF